MKKFSEIVTTSRYLRILLLSLAAFISTVFMASLLGLPSDFTGRMAMVIAIVVALLSLTEDIFQHLRKSYMFMKLKTMKIPGGGTIGNNLETQAKELAKAAANAMILQAEVLCIMQKMKDRGLDTEQVGTALSEAQVAVPATVLHDQVTALQYLLGYFYGDVPGAREFSAGLFKQMRKTESDEDRIRVLEMLQKIVDSLTKEAEATEVKTQIPNVLMVYGALGLTAPTMLLQAVTELSYRDEDLLQSLSKVVGPFQMDSFTSLFDNAKSLMEWYSTRLNEDVISVSPEGKRDLVQEEDAAFKEITRRVNTAAGKKTVH